MEELSKPPDTVDVPKATIAIGVDPVAPVMPVAASAPPQDVTAAVTQKKSSSVLLSVGIGLLILIATLSGGYLFYVLPRQNAVKVVSSLKPQVTALKTNTADLVDIMSKVYTLVTTDTTQTSPKSLNTTGLILHPVIANLRVLPTVLGAATESPPQLGILEHGILAVSQALKGTISVLNSGSGSVAGATTSTESPAVQNLRALKDETVVADTAVGKALTTLSQLLTTTSAMPSVLGANAKQKIGGSVTLNISASAYFSEVKKVANYYQTMSDMLISMNTKIDSFKTSIQSASSTFGSIFTANGPSQSVSATIAQSQIYLDQAKKDMTDLTTLSEKLKNIPSADLPYASADYHTHNSKVLDTVTTYFKTESTILQNLFDAAKQMDTKSQQNSVTVADVMTFRNMLVIGRGNAQLADTKFVSDLQSLLGEEHSLTVSFWENNTRLTTGPKLIGDIDSYQSSLEKVRQENTISFLPH